MERDRGMEILARGAWLSRMPEDFRRAILSGSEWRRFEIGSPLQLGGEETGELVGLADGIVEMRTVLGRADTPIMHLAHPVLWFGYMPILFGDGRRISAAARTPVWVARMSEVSLRRLLDDRPDWWRHFIQPTVTYGDVAVGIAADLLIRDSARRCAAVLLRLGGKRFASAEDLEPVFVPITQSELAGAANLSRNSVLAILGRLQGRGLVEAAYRGISVRSPVALRAFVETE